MEVQTAVGSGGTLRAPERLTAVREQAALRRDGDQVEAVELLVVQPGRGTLRLPEISVTTVDEPEVELENSSATMADFVSPAQE